MPDQIVGIVTLSGTPGVSLPVGSLVATSDGRIVYLAQPAVIGPDGRATVQVATSDPEHIRAFQKAEGLREDGIAGPQTRARALKLVPRTRYELIMCDDWL